MLPRVPRAQWHHLQTFTACLLLLLLSFSTYICRHWIWYRYNRLASTLVWISDALPVWHNMPLPEHSLSFTIIYTLRLTERQASRWYLFYYPTNLHLDRMYKFEHNPTFMTVFTAVGAAAGAGVRAAVSISPSSTPPRPVCPAPSVQSPTAPRTTHLLDI